MMPIKAGRFSNGAEPAKIVTLPFWMPDAPRPAMTRPAMKSGDELATPQISEPTSNTTKKARNVHLALRYVYSLPVSGCRQPDVRL